ncbi:NAD(P)-dependent oxidoreductase [Candidatus Pelagibacter sp.]|nr:NAD(P)-dependent oxidoreductase [Candidatus Pelagibacter sp.]
MSNILLTGSSGFIGSNILATLSKKNKIYIILRSRKRKKNLLKKNIKIINFKKYDALNLKLKKIKIDTVIHCATHYVKEHGYNDIKKLAESNILFGNIILENIDLMNVKKFINFSTVWENNDKTNGITNLYSYYKKAFTDIIKFYKKKFSSIKFYELMISDTFGKNDQRNKIINILRKNYKKDIATEITSKNLYLNLLNVEDIVTAINSILTRKIKPNQYVLKNTKNFKIFELIRLFNKKNEKKIKVKWQSGVTIMNKIYDYKKLKSWKPKKSNVDDIINLIKN